MPARHVFEYAVIRIVPRVEREEFVNAGVVLYCRSRRFLDLRTTVDAERLQALGSPIDLQAVAALLEHWALICRGDAGSGELGALSQAERFRWLTAPRSTVVQSSAVHCGMCHDPQAQLERLFQILVVPSRAASARLESPTTVPHPATSL